MSKNGIYGHPYILTYLIWVPIYDTMFAKEVIPVSSNNKFFPTSCFGCSNLYSHWSIDKQFSGGCIKSFGNSYCTGLSKHKRLQKKNVYSLRPHFCPRLNESPIPKSDEEPWEKQLRDYACLPYHFPDVTPALRGRSNLLIWRGITVWRVCKLCCLTWNRCALVAQPER